MTRAERAFSGTARRSCRNVPGNYQVMLGIGSNLEFPQAKVSQAIERIMRLPAIRVMCVSSFYLNAPHGPRFQPWYVNAVIGIRTRYSPLQLLRALQKLEQQLGRKRRRHWGPRTLDLDILLFGSRVLHHKQLTIPHPFILQRPFVMIPLHEIAPDLVLPDHGKIRDSIRPADSAGLISLTGVNRFTTSRLKYQHG